MSNGAPGDGDDGTADLDALFDDVDLEDVDDVWAELDDAEDTESVDGDLFERLAEENPIQTTVAEIEDDGETAVVPKTRYCQRCEYFSGPPEVSCNHPGTTIEAVVDSKQFRVRNCPVVAERHDGSDVLDVE